MSHTDELSALQAALSQWQSGQLTEAADALLALIPQLPDVSGSLFIELSDFLWAITEQQDNLNWQLSLQGQAKLALACIWKEQGFHYDALLLLEQLAESHPAARLYHLYGTWHFELGNYAVASLSWLQALMISPSYMPALTDLASLANLSDNPDLALAFIQQALPYGQSEALLQEMLLSCAQKPDLPMRSLFIELCVHHLTPHTRPLLVGLLQQLYDEGDYHHAAYLGFHLHLVFPHDSAILNHYVLAALQQGQLAPALKALLQAPEALFRQGSHWFKLGVVCERWNLSHFAHYAYSHALALDENLADAIVPRLEGLQRDFSLDSRLGQILRLLTVADEFRRHLRQDPVAALTSWGLEATPDLLTVLNEIPGTSTENLPSAADAEPML